jgi:hypothetical protein
METLVNDTKPLSLSWIKFLKISVSGFRLTLYNLFCVLYFIYLVKYPYSVGKSHTGNYFSTNSIYTYVVGYKFQVLHCHQDCTHQRSTP